jgi:hypothetical protein
MPLTSAVTWSRTWGGIALAELSPADVQGNDDD